ncbi:HPP family protein [Neptuniibacter sp.]|uniref:CBS domain-containing protein n=1 Tax=Neptuniibacter sp. TaxID=1962643 RepID=UPI003B58FCBD
MALYVYDHGYRIQTPKEALFKPGGVKSLTRSRHIHRAADIEDKLHADGEKFTVRRPLEEVVNHSADPASKAYAEFSEEPESDNEAASLTVSTIMVSPVYTTTESTPVVTAWKRMESLEISHLIISNDGTKPLGLLSKTDLAEAGKDSIKAITEIYSRKLIAATPETRVQDVAISFIENEINAMPVVDDQDTIVGIVCRTDLLRLLVSGPHLERWV